MKQFSKGYLFGVLTTLGAIASGAMAFHKAVVKPIEETEEKFDNNRQKANRKNRSAHQF